MLANCTKYTQSGLCSAYLILVEIEVLYRILRGKPSVRWGINVSVTSVLGHCKDVAGDNLNMASVSMYISPKPASVKFPMGIQAPFRTLCQPSIGASLILPT